MKKSVLSAERTFFPSFELRLSPKTAVKFVVECLIIFLMASVKDFGFALALGVLAGLIYARQNVLVLAPAYIIACCVFAMDWWMLLFSFTPIPLMVALYALFYWLRRNVPLWAVAVTAFAGMIPYVICGCVLDGAYLLVAISVPVAVTAVFVAGVTAYAILVRGFMHTLAVEEQICAGILAVIFGFALSGVRAYGFSIFYTVLAFSVLLSVICFKSKSTLFLSILLGLGDSLYSGDLSALAAAVAVGAVAVAFIPFTKWASAAGILAAQGIMWLLDAYPSAGWQTLIMSFVGVAVCLSLPRHLLERVSGMRRGDDGTAYSGIVNRRGRELAGRLYSTSDVFYDMSKRMDDLSNARTPYTAEKLAQEVARSYCAKCADREVCFSALGEDTASVLISITEAAISRGKATILDTPPFITSRCTRTHSLINVINSSAESYIRRRELSDGAMLGKKLMSEQFAGIALVLDSLADKCSAPISFSDGDIDYIKCELLKHNIVASELVTSSEGERAFATAVVRDEDANKAMLSKVVSKCMKQKLEVSGIEERGDKKVVYLESAPMFEIAYGIAERVRGEAGVSGDSRSILCPSRSQRLFAICDGMGSGESASKASRDAVSMIESFYRAGFDNKIILSLVNKLLKLSLEDSFTTLDIAIIDTSSGGLDVIKLGSASSFIVRRDGMEMLSCTLPPAGILDTVQPLTSRYQLYEGDMLIMMSDGVFDALDKKGVVQAVESMCTLNPQTLADGLLARALSNGAEDDCTVLVMRLFAV